MNITASASFCHGVYYGTVTQFGKGLPWYAHEYPCYVDLLNAGITNGGLWEETSGTTHGRMILTIFTNSFGDLRQGWGWKTAPFVRRWNDQSVYKSPPGSGWQPGF